VRGGPWGCWGRGGDSDKYRGTHGKPQREREVQLFGEGKQDRN